MLIDFVRRLFRTDRRSAAVQVEKDRRKPRMKQADTLMVSSIDHLDRTIRLRRSIRAQNDPQNIVEFSTFTEICTFKGPEIAGQTMCRHVDFKGMPTACAQHHCPFMNKQRKTAEVA